jgi:hypothetical protein
MIEVAKFIVMWSTSNVEAALKSLRSGEAAKTRVALRLARRGAPIRRRSVLYAIAERAQWLEEMGVDRQTATELLLAEYRTRVEQELRATASAYNTVVFISAMTFLMGIVISMLGILNPDAATYASAFAAFALLTAFLLEGIVPPVRRWDYRIAAAAMLPAVAGLFWTPAIYATVPVAALYGMWYLRLRREAEEELDLALRGKLQAASTDLAKEALDVIRAIRASGAYFLQSAGEHILRIVENYYKSIRNMGLMRAFVMVAIVMIGVMAVSMLQKPLTEMVAKVRESPAPVPLNIYTVDYRGMIAAFAFVAAVVAGRMAESYAMSPLFTPLMLAALLV